MLFNSYGFILFFLPICLLGYFLLGRKGGSRLAFAWLAGCSLLFYGAWNVAYPFILLGSVGFNFFLGQRLAKKGGNPFSRKMLLGLGIGGNLLLLGYCKYVNFFIESISSFWSPNFSSLQVMLPLAVSFFSFQQIAYLVDSAQGKTEAHTFLDYLLFVSFFPKLTAGPIVTYGEMFPQLTRPDICRFRPENLAVGLTIFSVGLFKKVIVAEQAARYANPLFGAAFNGVSTSFFEAWGGVLAYSFQIYFDFSGYSDMAIGLARMFGFVLPENFNSPYKSRSITEFWRCWHISLSNFLKRYIYIPLGGNRLGSIRKHLNLMITMVLAGAWHGAGWTFVVWGGMHGAFLVINNIWHGWHQAIASRWRVLRGGAYDRFACLVTFLAVSVAWVFFRAENMATSFSVLGSLFGRHGFAMPYDFQEKLNAFLKIGDLLAALGVPFTSAHGLLEKKQLVLLALMGGAVSLLPNTQQIMELAKPGLNITASPLPGRLGFARWRPNNIFLLITLVLFLVSFLTITQKSEFIYFRF